jgi:hypothetical protein
MSTRNCENCNTAYGPDDMFCENCGYDFVTGSLPADAAVVGSPAVGSVPPGVGAPPAAPSVLSPDGPPAESAISGSGSPGSGSPGSGPAEATEGDAGNGGSGETDRGSDAKAKPSDDPMPDDVPRLRILISADRAYFDEVVNDGEIDFPDPPPAETELELAGTELHIGRTSESRAIHPDIDVAELTGDQAVSSRHAVLRAADGGYTIVDVGSTNGTFLATVDSEAITQGVAVEVEAGTPIFVGAWTRITVLG